MNRPKDESGELPCVIGGKSEGDFVYLTRFAKFGEFITLTFAAY